MRVCVCAMYVRLSGYARAWRDRSRVVGYIVPSCFMLERNLVLKYRICSRRLFCCCCSDDRFIVDRRSVSANA